MNNSTPHRRAKLRMAALFAMVAALALAAPAYGDEISGTLIHDGVEYPYSFEYNWPDRFRNGFEITPLDPILQYNQLQDTMGLVPSSPAFQYEQDPLTSTVVPSEQHLELVGGLIGRGSPSDFLFAGQNLEGLSSIGIQSPAAQVVPEPSVVSLIVLSLGSLGIRRWMTKCVRSQH